MLNRITAILQLLTFYLILLFSYCQSATAFSSNKYGVYLSPGTMQLKVNELVYSNGSKLSHLIWETKNAPIIILGFKKHINHFFSFNIEARRLSANGEGVMDDYDWLKPGLDWSEWSHHEDTKLTQATSYDLSLSLNLIDNNNSNISILAGYKKDIWAWKSYGGTYIYSSASGYRDLSGSFTTGSPAIDYTQKYSTLYLGINIEAPYNNWLFKFQYITSSQVNLDTTDIHHARNLIFTDNFEPGKMTAYKLGAGYQFNHNLSVRFLYDIQNFKEVLGGTTTRSSTTGAVTNTCIRCAGSDNSSTTLSIGLSLLF